MNRKEAPSSSCVAMPFCGDCGAKVPDGEEFCGECGKKLGEATTVGDDTHLINSDEIAQFLHAQEF